MSDTDANTAGADASIGWPAATVAVAIVALVGTITVAAILAYDTPDEALEVWTAMSGLVGLITGVFVTYFFTRGAVAQANSQEQQARQRAKSAEQLAQREADHVRVTQRALIEVAGRVDKAEWEQLRKEPTVQTALSIGQDAH